MSEQREKKPTELGTLIELARRFAPADWEQMPADGYRLFDLMWWRTALAAAIQQVLPNDRILFSKARAPDADDAALIELWSDVADLPYSTVERMLVFVHRQAALWDIEDSLDSSPLDER